LLVGDGPARAEIEALMEPFGARVALPASCPCRLPATYASADLYLGPRSTKPMAWPFLEAQAAACRRRRPHGGVPAVVADASRAVLTPIGDAAAFAAHGAAARRSQARAAARKAAAARCKCRTTSAPPPTRWRVALRHAAMSVPFACCASASTDWNVERRLQAYRHPAQAAARPVPAPGACRRRRRLEAAQQPLQRARRTAELLQPSARHRRLGAARDELRHLGRPPIAELREGVAGFHCCREQGLDFQPPAGESPRAAMADRRWTADRRAGQPFVAVSHKARIRALLALATGWDMMGRPPHKLDWRCLHFFRPRRRPRLGRSPRTCRYEPVFF
jgi:probable phosphoglycerate mutase